MPHQANILYDVFGDGRHLIAKEFLSDMDLDSPLNEYRALRLVEPLDMAPRPVFFDPDVGQVVVYEFLEGVMWDRRVPSAAALAALADRWVELHALTIDGLWIGRGQARNAPNLVGRLRAPIERYVAWAAGRNAARRMAADACLQALERGLADGLPLIPDVAPLCFCRSDARFAYVIGRPDGRVGLVDWEDSGLRDPARELADLLLHPNQEDLLGAAQWQPFLERYMPRRATDPGFAERLRGYLALFPLFWLGVLLTDGLQRVAHGALETRRINDMVPNDRLRRYVARGLAWPTLDPADSLAEVAHLAFF
jgi:hypothetical protein